MFYLLFGDQPVRRNPTARSAPAEYLLASYCVFGVVAAALFAFGAGVAVRARARLDAAEARDADAAAAPILARRSSQRMAFGTIILVLMGLCGVTLGGVRFPAATWLRSWAVLVLGCVPFCFVGLIIAFTVPPRGAPGIVNLINLPLSFAGGLWLPVESCGRRCSRIAPVLPQYHLGQLALGAIGAVRATPDPLRHVVALVASRADLRRAGRGGHIGAAT